MNKNTIISIVLGVLFALLSIRLQAQQKVNPAKSYATFVVTNLGIEVEGKARGMRGTVAFKADALEESSFKVALPVRSIRTGNGMRDEHLQEEEFFDAAEYPNISFQSMMVEKVENGYLVKGNLRMKGKSQMVNIPFSQEENSFKGKLVIDRNDFGVGGDGFLNTIGDEVKIEIICVLAE